MSKFSLSCALLAGTAFCTGTAYAQDTQPAADPNATASSSQQASADTTDTAPQADAETADIIVTAQRRAERVQDVPIAISVVTGQQLERQQILEVRDLGRTTASLQFGPTGGGAPGSGAFIRGIGTIGFSKAAEAAVGLVVDGVVQGNTNISNLFDIGRVEVLRGPQGTLFGQSVSAGVINITTVDPNPRKIEGKASLELSDDGFLGSKFGRQIGRLAVNVPVSETSAIRVSAFGARTAGIGHNAALDEDDRLKEFGFRARYKGEFGPVTLNLIGDYSKSDADYFGFFTSFYKVPEGSLLEQLLNECGAEIGPKSFDNCANNKDEVSDTKTWGLSGQADIAIGEHTLTSITAFRKQPNKLRADIDRLNNSTLDIFTFLDTNFKQFTQELRLASPTAGVFSYTVGAFYQSTDTLNDQLTDVTLDFLVPLPPPIPPIHVQDFHRDRQVQNTDVSNVSIFGEGRVNLDHVVLFAGARINRNKVSQTATQQAILPVEGNVETDKLTYKDTDISWRLGGQYNFTPDIMLYATAARGYKSAQLDNISFSEREPAVVFPEKPLDFQLGLKSTFMNGRLAANVNLFHTKVKDYQVQRCILLTVSQLQCLPIIVSKVITQGIEADVFGRIGRHLTVNANLMYNVAKYPNDFVDNDGNSLGGQQIAFAPRWKTTLSGEYAAPLSGQIEGFVSADATYKGKTRLAIDGFSSDYIYPDRLIIGGRVGARVSDKWSVALFGRNLTNKPLPTQLGNAPVPIDTTGGTPGTGIWQWQSTQSKRLIGLQADFQF